MHKSHKTLGALICNDLSASSWLKFQAATACSGKHCVQIIGRLDRNGAGNILMQKTPTCTENQCKLKHAFFRHWGYGQESGRSQVIPAPMDPDPQTSHGLTEWLQFQWGSQQLHLWSTGINKSDFYHWNPSILQKACCMPHANFFCGSLVDSRAKCT